MYKLLKSKKLLALSITLLFVSVNASAREDQVIHLRRGFTVPLQLPENAATVALGNPDLVGINTLKPNFLMINGQDTGTTSLTVIGKSNSIYQYQLVVGNDVYQLRQLIGLVDKGVTVNDVNGVIVLRGKVASTAALTRVLSVADRFVGGNGTSSIKVLSDHGGVLAGNINGSTEFEPPLDTVINEVGVLNTGGRGGRGQRNAGRNVNRALPIMDAKGNLAQNLQRADVISLAGGKVISLIKVAKQPKV
jgi:Flp pilus assembly secretin CpaC